ncbi:glycerophosphoryl diester phosphodiesterase [Sulfurimonas gotlandica GD1]|uniref:Glycerophosphoryl diester phosphodiesterase n=1 Tax=Sulfurimonas gotlandica (strain DSM 19862 / JCM 16533 / GD1) TaxID=929558 RepID=H1FXM4_SULGG|nr:glycerophosphodiester phosphodiesterase family protein [Sulfurimonas gotlandica]EHP29456.1 glycerophosphoryl diester phosphodiesterase [Sulfurimonas gotlandica GD1]
MSFLELFKRPCLIGAHRGSRALYPENTLCALEKSIGHCDFIEIDVQLSSDKILVVMHDDTLERTTNIKELDAYKSREPYKVSDFSYEELSTLDYGSWFYSDEIKPEPLLTLKIALEFIKENHLFINIEIKDIHNSFEDKEVISLVLQEIAESKIKDHVLISSFRHQYLLLSKEIQPDIPTAVLVEKKHPKNLINYLKSLRVDAYHCSDKLADEITVGNLKSTGFYVNIYTVNDPIRRQQLFDMGVNGVFSDYLE